MALSLEDLHYAESSYRTQRIALRFAHTLDPHLLTQALHLAIIEYPRVGSRLVIYNDVPKFHLEAGEITVRFVSVAPDVIFSGACAWDHACHSMTPTKKAGYGPDATQLFEACLLASTDREAGCVLVVGFQHVLGDATSYALFLRKWPDIYHARAEGKPLDQMERVGRAHETANTWTAPGASLPRPELPKDAFAVTASIMQGSASPSRRCFHFSAQRLLSLKQSMGRTLQQSMGRTLSTNDILMAQFACTIAPWRLAALRSAAGLPASRDPCDVCADSLKDPINTPARILVLADHRGRGIEHGVWGNHSVDLSVLLSFRLLLSGDVGGVARAISGALHYEMHKLEHDLALYNLEKKQNARKDKLFLWNSWSRIGHGLAHARFGGDEHSLLGVDWINMASLDASDGGTIVALSPCCTKGISIAVAIGAPSAPDEFHALSALWPSGTDVDSNPTI